MRVLVIDVAAEYGGAKTVLDEHIKQFKLDNDKYLVVVSTLDYDDCKNVKFLKLPWVKRSYLHRIYFDNIFVKYIVKKYRPDKILSLQNKSVSIKTIPQEVFFHNALPISEKRFSFQESKMMWIYQNIIGNIYRYSLKRASVIYVQAEWIKNALINQWNVRKDKIIVKKTIVDIVYNRRQKYIPTVFFYPANGELYKNHEVLIKALIQLWSEYPKTKDFSLVLTGSIEDLPQKVQWLLNNKNYPIEFVGRLSFDNMIKYYQKSILVFPSYIETVGLPLLEARKLGCSIIAANCEYAHEALANYENVRYFNPHNIKELKRIMHEVIEKNRN